MIVKTPSDAFKGVLTANKASERLSEEGQQCVHIREGVRLPRVTLQHGPAGGHVQSGRVNGVHSGVWSSAASGRKGETKTLPDSLKSLRVDGGNITRPADDGGGGGAKNKKSATPACQCRHVN